MSDQVWEYLAYCKNCDITMYQQYYFRINLLQIETDYLLLGLSNLCTLEKRLEAQSVRLCISLLQSPGKKSASLASGVAAGRACAYKTLHPGSTMYRG